jgi:hypothetical protein
MEAKKAARAAVAKNTIPYKLFMRLQELQVRYAETKSNEDRRALVAFEDQIGWPRKASQEQLNDWNAWMKRSGMA